MDTSTSTKHKRGRDIRHVGQLSQMRTANAARDSSGVTRWTTLRGGCSRRVTPPPPPPPPPSPPTPLMEKTVCSMHKKWHTSYRPGTGPTLMLEVHSRLLPTGRTVITPKTASSTGMKPSAYVGWSLAIGHPCLLAGSQQTCKAHTAEDVEQCDSTTSKHA